MQYVYPCDFTPDAEEGDGFVVTFPDIPPAITGAKTFKESIILAEDALVVALSIYVDRQKELPVPSPLAEGQELIGVQPLIAAQLDLYTAMREQNITKADLAKRLDISEAAAGKLLILDYHTPISQVIKALEAVGRKLVVEGRAA
jgi:antitoxin HicB